MVAYSCKDGTIWKYDWTVNEWKESFINSLEGLKELIGRE